MPDSTNAAFMKGAVDPRPRPLTGWLIAEEGAVRMPRNVN